jgi:drug/metabolite transporter (DMT)-like permease
MPGVLWLTMFGGSRLDPGRVSVLLMLEVVVGVASAAFLTNEAFGAREALAALLVTSACGAEVWGGR